VTIINTIHAKYQHKSNVMEGVGVVARPEINNNTLDGWEKEAQDFHPRDHRLDL